MLRNKSSVDEAEARKRRKLRILQKMAATVGPACPIIRYNRRVMGGATIESVNMTCQVLYLKKFERYGRC